MTMHTILREPVLAGLGTGLALALAVTLFASSDDLKPDHFRSSVGVATALFFVPAFILTFYAARTALEDPRKWAILRVLWPVGAAWFSLGIGWTAISDWNATQRFDREGEKVPGEVTDVRPQDHGMLFVRYVVAGTSYESHTSAPEKASAYVPGENIEVYYYASAPNEGFCRRPSWRPATLLEGWALAAGIGPVFLAFLAGGFPPR